MKPYFETEHGVIYQGNALEVLKQLSDKSIHCCVTSPPYWGLRAYGTNPQVWGGDSDCEHVWCNENLKTYSNYNEGFNERCGNADGKRKQENGCYKTISLGQFCQKCGDWKGELGLEPTPELFVEHLVEIFREVKRVLRDDGVLFLNLGDSYAANRGYQVHNTKGAKGHTYNNGSKIPNGLKPKDLVGIPWRVAFALQADGWYLRQDIIWHKPNPMPESVTDRCTKAHEYIFLLSKSQKYYYDHEAIKEPQKTSSIQRQQKKWNGDGERDFPGGPQNHLRNYYKRVNKAGPDLTRNKRSVWTCSTKPFSGAHFATFPPNLIEPCILAGCPKGGTVLDPFGGAMTTAIVAYKHGRKFITIELSEKYIADIGVPRIEKETRQLKLF